MSDWICDFGKDYQYSLDHSQMDRDVKLIKKAIPGTIKVEKTDTQTDKTGIDYIVTLDGGSQVYIDTKTRYKGCRQFWKDGEEVSIEYWSVVPGNGRKGTPGWAFDVKKKTDYILFTFHPEDSKNAYLIPFQILRKAAMKNGKAWMRLRQNNGTTHKQNNGTYQSSCVFVPISRLIEDIQSEYIVKVEDDPNGGP